jgi:hypothetical protein
LQWGNEKGLAKPSSTGPVAQPAVFYELNKLHASQILIAALKEHAHRQSITLKNCPLLPEADQGLVRSKRKPRSCSMLCDRAQDLLVCIDAKKERSILKDAVLTHRERDPG